MRFPVPVIEFPLPHQFARQYRVLDRHVAAGIAGSCGACPWALATQDNLERAGYQLYATNPVMVDGFTAWVHFADGTLYWGALPAEVTAWIFAFDRRGTREGPGRQATITLSLVTAPPGALTPPIPDCPTLTDTYP